LCFSLGTFSSQWDQGARAVSTKSRAIQLKNEEPLYRDFEGPFPWRDFMHIPRKLQISAVAVIANGMGALAAMSPSPVFATSCEGFTVCIGLTSCPGNMTQWCAQVCAGGMQQG
jgi:hypothetical protein